VFLISPGVCIHTHVNIHVYICSVYTHTHTHTCTRTNTHTHTHLPPTRVPCTPDYTHKHTRAHTHTHAHTISSERASTAAPIAAGLVPIDAQLEALHMALALEWRTPSQEAAAGNHFQKISFTLMRATYGTCTRMSA